MSAEASPRELSSSPRELAYAKPGADERPVRLRAFLPTLRRLDRDLTVPISDRLRILRELEFDLEALSGEFEARGMPSEKAHARALVALVPDGATLRELDRLHASHYRRLTRYFSPGRLRTIERSALVLATVVVLLVETFLLLRADWLRHASLFLWPVLGLGALLFAAIFAQLFRLWVKHDHQDPAASFRIILFLSGLTLATGVFGTLADFFRLAGVLEIEPELARLLLLDWLGASSVLLSVSLLLALAGGLAWFIPAHWLALVFGAHAKLLGNSLPETRLGAPQSLHATHPHHSPSPGEPT